MNYDKLYDELSQIATEDLTPFVGRLPSEPTGNGTVYLSGPITGESYEAARFGWRKYVADRLSPGIRALSPMRHEGHLAEIKGDLAKHYPDHYFSGARIIFEKDRLDIERSDIMMVNLLGAKKVSIGTVAEIGMAHTMGKQIILVMEDEGNVHDHPFVTVPASLRLNNLDDAVDAVNSLLSEGI